MYRNIHLTSASRIMKALWNSRCQWVGDKASSIVPFHEWAYCSGSTSDGELSHQLVGWESTYEKLRSEVRVECPPEILNKA